MTIKALREVMLELSTQLKEDSHVAENVSEVTSDNVGELEKAYSQINLISDSMEEMTKASKDIGAVLKEINSIASQTNLLSLNASVEAARALQLWLWRLGSWQNSVRVQHRSQEGLFRIPLMRYRRERRLR